MLRYFIFSSKTVASPLPADPVKVTAVEAEPGWLDLQASIEKTIFLISDVGRNGAQILSFPTLRSSFQDIHGPSGRTAFWAMAHVFTNMSTIHL